MSERASGAVRQCWLGVLLVATSLGVGACAEESDGAGSTAEGIDEAASSWSLGPAHVLIPGEDRGEGRPPLFNVVDAAVEDSVIAIAHSGALTLVDHDGAFLGSLGGPGEGPGEFRDLRWVEFAGDTVFSYEASRNQVDQWNERRGLLATHPIERPSAPNVAAVEAHGMLEDGSFLVSARLFPTERILNGSFRPTVVLSLYTPSGAMRDSLDTVLGDEIALNDGVIFRPESRLRTHVASRGNLVAVSEGTLGTSFLLTPGKSVRIPLDLVGSKFDSTARVDAVNLDDSGRAWLEVTTSQEGPVRSAWLVVDRSGKLVAQLEAPPATHILAISTDDADVRIVAVQRDELDVESIVIFTVRRSLGVSRKTPGEAVPSR